MSANLSLLKSSDQFPYHLFADQVAKPIEPEVVRSRLTIRSSKNSAIFYSKLLRPEGGFEPDLNGFLNQKQSASTAGRVKPQLNEFLSQPVGVEFESNCSRTTVNQAKKLFQSQELPPQNPTTGIKIDHQKIPIGFGGGAEGGGGSGPIVPDLFSQTRWSSGAKMPSGLLGTVRKDHSFLIRFGCALP